MNVDILSQICVYCDYPLFRAHLEARRDHFNRLILYPSRHHGFRDFEPFLKENLKTPYWIERQPIDYGKEDWRQAETIPMLEFSTADWLWFREADFFVDNWEKFFEDAERLSQSYDLFGWSQNENRPYIHPCCLFIKRELLERTSKDFRAHPEVLDSDHFSMITQDAKKLGARITSLQENGYANWVNAFHMQGLTYPYQNWSTDRIFGVTNISSFYAYNLFSRWIKTVQNDEYISLSYELEDYMKRHFTFNESEVEKWTDFYKV